MDTHLHLLALMQYQDVQVSHNHHHPKNKAFLRLLERQYAHLHKQFGLQWYVKVNQLA